MLIRFLLLAIVLILAGIFSFRHRRTQRNSKIKLPEKFSEGNALPTVLYFWTDQCVQCNSLQKPALNSLHAKSKDFNLISLNAANEHELVSAFQIKTVPSTIVFGSDGSSRFINNGFISEKELESQINILLN